MSLLTSLVLLILSFIGYTNDKKILNPLFIMPFIWGIILLLFNIIPHNLYALQTQFLFSVLLWVTSFMMVCYLTSFVKLDVNISLYNKNIFNIYFYTVTIFAPLALVLLVLEAIKVGPELFLIRLRDINTGMDEDNTFSLGPLGYVFNFSNVVCLIFTYYYSKISKIKYFTVLALTFLLGLITLARTNLIILSLSIFVILYFKNILSKKHYFTFIITFISFIFLVTVLRDSNPFTEQSSFADTFSIYLFGAMPAFDTLSVDKFSEFGSYTFRFFYAFSNAFGSSYEVKKNILEYAYVPTPTNVYTIMFPFFFDFGYVGVAVFGLIYGAIFGFFYQMAKLGNSFMIIIYGIICPCLFLQFMGENLFMNISTYLQYTIILLIPNYLKLSR